VQYLCNLIIAMFKFFLILCTSLFCFNLFGQTPLSGIINIYSKVTSIDSCANAVVVQNASLFENTDKVIIMQMKGAEINQANSAAYGNIFNYGGVGNYEINTIESIAGNTIFFKYKFINYYRPEFATQVISIPKYTNAIVVDTLKAQKWNGNTGGVLALEADNLTLNAPIDVSGTGYRGGNALPTSDPTNNCSWLTSVADYWLPRNNWRGAEKGEGIAEVIAGKEFGRGAHATGGGGGNDHNSGGGGGANIERGGNGGRNDDKNTFSCTGLNPGVGGKAIEVNYAINHFFMGGGGGAGHGNNGVASSGGAGGGIVMLLGKNINANNQAIKSNGQDAKDTSGDGAGGGGAGGTIIFDMETISAGTLFVEAKGGKGGNLDNQGQQRCFGPGGGGSGGRIVYTSPFPVIGTFSGGTSGMSKNGSCQNAANNAEKGTDGYDELFPYLNVAKAAIQSTAIIQQPKDDTLCIGANTRLKIAAVGIGLSYQWQVSSNGTDFTNLFENSTYDGVKEDELIISKVTSSMQFNEYQCIISDACGKILTTNKVRLFLDSIPKADFNITLIGNQILCTNKSVGTGLINWDFGDGSFSSSQNPIHLYTNDGDFTVEFSIQNQCGIDFKSQLISIVTPPIASFKSDSTIGCAPLNIKFINTSTNNVKSFQWTFEGGTPATSNDENPVVTYLKAGVFGVTLEVTNSKFSASERKASLVIISEKPTVEFIYSLQNTSANFTNLSSSNATAYRWDFSDGTFAVSKDIIKNFNKDGNYAVTLTATNSCGSVSLSKTIKIETKPSADFTTSTIRGCVPLNVQFQSKASSSTKLWQWRFPGAEVDTSTVQNPIVRYTKPGSYDVFLKVENSSGVDSIVKKQLIIVEDKPLVEFTVQADLLKASFLNQTVNYTSLLWSFDQNNQTSTVENPIFEYNKSGTYSVSLAATNACGTALLKKEVSLSNRIDCEQIKVVVAPNPAFEITTLKFNASRNSKIPYILSSIDGKVIQRGELEEEPLSFDFLLDRLPSGIYLLYLKCDSKNMTQKILKVIE
jgi:PKD repeat protein